MWYEWVIFGFTFLTTPLVFGYYRANAEKKHNLSEEQRKKADITLVTLILFYWLCDLFYMSFIIDNLTWRFIFGVLIMVIIFFNLSKAFINSTPQPKWGLVQDFIVGVGISIYLIYIIPNSNLQTIVTAIVSAVYGGLLTLVGVAWTI